MTQDNKAMRGTTGEKKKRVRRPQYFHATILGNDEPVIIVAATQKAALKAIVTLKPAGAQELIEAGKNSHRVLNTSGEAL